MADDGWADWSDDEDAIDERQENADRAYSNLRRALHDGFTLGVGAIVDAGNWRKNFTELELDTVVIPDWPMIADEFDKLATGGDVFKANENGVKVFSFVGGKKILLIAHGKKVEGAPPVTDGLHNACCQLAMFGGGVKEK